MDQLGGTGAAFCITKIDVFRASLKLSSLTTWLRTDMEKGADARTLSAEIFENCGNFWIVEEYLLLLLREIYRS